MRLVDAVLRQGHLSERVLTEALLSGDRPAHLDRCDVCAERAIELSRWLDDVRRLGLEAADAAFSPEMLQAQHGQVMRRLEQLAQPSTRIIAFPVAAAGIAVTPGRRVAAGWLGVAAAAGLVLGVVGGQVTARMDRGNTQFATSVAVADPDSKRKAPDGFSADDLLRSDIEHISVPALDVIHESTPKLTTNSGG